MINDWWKVIPGSVKATACGEHYKVKEKLKGEWKDGKLIRFLVTGYSVTSVPASVSTSDIKISF